jgi:hypothetical protein
MVSTAGVGKWVPACSSAARVMALLAPSKDGVRLGTAWRVGLEAALQSLVPIWRPHALNLKICHVLTFYSMHNCFYPNFWNCTFTTQLVIFFVAF